MNPMNESTDSRLKDLADEVGDQFSKDIDEDYRKLKAQFLEDVKQSSASIIQDSIPRQDQLPERIGSQPSAGHVPGLDPSPDADHLKGEYDHLREEKAETDAKLEALVLEKEALDADRQALEKQIGDAENALSQYKENTQNALDALRLRSKNQDDLLGDAMLFADERRLEKEQTEEKLSLINREKDALDAGRQSLEEQIIESEKAFNTYREDSEKITDRLQQRAIDLENQLSKSAVLADEHRRERQRAEEERDRAIEEKRTLASTGGSPGTQVGEGGDPGESIYALRERNVDLESRLGNATILADERLVDKERAE